MITQRNLTSLLWAMKRQFGVGSEDVVLAVTTLSFDIAGLELYLPLIAGGQVVIYGGVAGDGEELSRALRASGATLMQGTPTTWRELLAAGGGAGLGGVRVLCGGEALRADLARQLRAVSGEVWNMYGPTETTVWSVCGAVGERGVKLGRGIENTQVYVLDGEMEPVPVGVWGELYIGGAGVGRGYWGRAELTAERFVPDGYGAELGGRLYRTGDICRYQWDGELEYQGRQDEQVKVRGQRIELGEIEAALNKVTGVKESVVVVGADEQGEPRIIGYVVSAAGSEVKGAELRAALRQSLPEHMVPTVFVSLGALPLTGNGKIDRRALPAVVGQGGESAASYVAARTPVEELMAGIWREVLHLEQVGVHDNFFDLGGHSLLATRIMSRVRNAFAVQLPLRAIFEAPTVAGLSESVVNTQEREQGGSQEIAGILKDLEHFSDDQIKALLQQAVGE
jgi:acyl-coenzyme A synthetase/AMP-(fatty) acid ligase